jgi:hypothetical protein
MTPLPDTAYVLVGRCLAPSLTDIQKDELALHLARPNIRWENLLAEANRQHATPLWYVRLQEHGLLAHLPADLTAYLAELHAANRARNRMLRDELAMILEIFNAQGIPVILLKGAATFADALYADDGARLMGDMDLLVREEHLREAERLLMMEGYVDDPANISPYDVWPGNARHAHIPGLLHMKKKTAVELHYKVAYGQAGRILTAEAAWASALSGTFRGHVVAWLYPHHRLLHNALHATLPHREFLQARVRLSDIAEFVALIARYPAEVALDHFWATIRRHGLATAIGNYALMARLLMRTVIKAPEIRPNNWHRGRLLETRPAAVNHAGRLAGARAVGWQAVSFVYDLVNFPAWVWRNVCYGDDQTSRLARLGCIGRQVVTRLLRTVRAVVGKVFMRRRRTSNKIAGESTVSDQLLND